ncbi:hypothetical protein D9M72_321420 [compost metagenome]
MFHVKHVSVQQSCAVALNDVGKWQRHRIGQTQYVGICRCFPAVFHVKQQRLERGRAPITHRIAREQARFFWSVPRETPD